MSTRRGFIMQAAAAGLLTAEGSRAQESLGITQKGTDAPTKPTQSMRTYKIPKTDIAVSCIGCGCADFGDWNAEALSSDSIKTAGKIIHAAYDSGITLFDLSDVYAFGKAEAAVGAVLKESPGLRQRIVIQSKAGMVFPVANAGDIYEFDCSYEHILGSVDGSLRRLGTDYLDILLLHWSDALVEPDEVAKAFDMLKRAGKVRAFGVSNHTPWQIELLKAKVEQNLVVNQIRLGLGLARFILEGFANTYFDTRPQGITGTLDYCRKNEIQVQAYEPLRGGVLNPGANASAAVKEAARVLAQFAKQKNTTPATLALAWLLRHPAQIVPITSSSKPEHIVENGRAAGVSLSRNEWYALFRAAAKIEA